MTEAFSGTVTLVTGAGRGIGAAIARRFAFAGSDLVLVARSRDQLEGVARGARELGRTVLAIPADLTDLAVAGALVEETARDLDDAFRFNVAASFALTKEAVPHLMESDHTSVINISSRMDRLVARGLLTVEDVAGTALWLASPEASYITGQDHRTGRRR
jgi:7-alpha-hydroxysteroid dehydrogenase